MADFYSVLGISKTATKDEIGKAYRKLAKKYHPDLHPDDKDAKAKFQEVQEAFDVLNDDDKRKKYDQFGPGFENMSGAGPGGPGGPGAGGFRGGQWSGAGPGGGTWEFNMNDIFGAGGPQGAGAGAGAGFDPRDIFSQFGGGAGASGFSGFGGGGRRRRAPVRGNDLHSTLSISFEESVLGSEANVRIQSGSGEVKTVTAKIPAGIEDCKKLRLAGLGETSPNGGAAGDLVLEISVRPHPVFTRNGKDLLLRLPVTISEAVLGAKVPIPTPKGEGVLNIPAGTSSGRKLRVKGLGVQMKSGAGDLLVEIMINVPTGISPEEAETLRGLDKKYSGNLRSGIAW